MTDAEELFEELQSELQDTGQTLGELLQQAVEEPSSAPDVVADLLQEAQETGRSLGELLQDAVESSDDIVGEVTDGNLLVDTGDDRMLLDLENTDLPLDPTDDEFLRQLDVLGVGEELGLIESGDEE